MSIDIELLRELTQTPGIASREDEIRAVVAGRLRPLVDSLSVDPVGNLIGVRSGEGGPRIAIIAHVDEIGFLVRHIDDQGFIRIQRVGGFDPRVLPAQRVKVQTRSGEFIAGVLQPGTKPIHLQQPGDAKDLKLDDLYVDVGLMAEKVRERVHVGDMVTLDRDLIEVGDTVVSKAMDDRVGVFVMLEAIRKSTSRHAEIVAIASTQEEVGLRGAHAAAYTTEPDVTISLDVTIAADIPGSPAEAAVTRLGAGTAIKVMDSSQISNPKLVTHLRDLAEQHSIPVQDEILPFGGNDGGAFVSSRGGRAVVSISIPCRYVHTVNEMVSVSDVQASIDLVAAFIDAAGERSYGYETPGANA